MANDYTTNDRQLTANDIGMLENAEQVVHFIAGLGYDVDNSIPLGHAALGMDTTDLQYQIRNIRRVGEDPVDGDIVIYLFEMQSVTVTLTQTIARRFRERSENALLVLTKDYESLDFVLVERELAAGKRMGGGFRQVIRPRTLTVNRRNPTPVDLRVLKRFTFTEAEAVFQWEKLRSAFTLAEWTEQYFNNRALFSDYYLLERLTDDKLTPAWAEDVRPVGREVYRHLASARPDYSGQPEEMIRQGLFEPLFARLGFDFVVNKTGDSDLDEPDYKLYAPGDHEKPIALVMTYVWNRNLDNEDLDRDKETPHEIPGALVVNVLAQAETNWVIVTNGKLWRLYSTTADNKATNYYEIDLEEAVTAPGNDQITALKYWWLFFRRQAFQGFLDDLLQQSADYAKSLGERLKDRTFTTIFPHFAEGFIRQMRSNGESEPNLEAAFAATMTFLYRLMFILYAESLNLLPVTEERGYGEHSLHRLKKELAGAGRLVEEEAAKGLSQQYQADATTLYERLQLLFHAIDQGAQELNLPMYNGGLFSDDTAEGKFLAAHAIPDRYLALGLDRLCRDVDDKTLALAFIDYKSLGVRQLGSIYEGLLEFKLRVAAEKLVVVKEKGKEVYLPAKKAGKKRAVTTLSKGDVYLENDKRERKATGSYYTPDYIVKYIVAHTVGPVLERKFEALEPRLREAQKRYRLHKATVAARGSDQPAELFWNEPDMRQLADDCLDITVLDPAMGSGHFLVEAVDFISDRLIAFLNGWSENPVWGLLERTRQEILADMERQKVSVDAERLTRVALLKRSVLKRCIYGVDLNEMAVELAKVSLWLDAFTLGAPLSFLDHHLKWGNSLIGARVSEVEAALGREQMSFFAQSKFVGVMLAADLMRQVSFLSDNTAGQLAESRAAFRSARDHLAPYKRVLDVYTSRWFGNHPNVKKADAFDPCVEFLHRDDVEPWLRDPESVTLPEKDYMEVRKIGETALRVAAEKRFFHWELEFPEVFFAPGAPGGQDVQLREGGGFDAVVGNPPYANAIETGTARGVDELQYLSDNFVTTRGAYDLYIPFMETGSLLCSPHARISMIVPNKWLAADYGNSMRNMIVDSLNLQLLADYSSVGVFGEAAVYPIVFVLQSNVEQSDIQIEVYHNKISNPFGHSVRKDIMIEWKDISWGLLILPFNFLTSSTSQDLQRISDLYEVTASASAGEAYEMLPHVKEYDSTKAPGSFRLLTSGNIDRFESHWALGETTYLKHQFRRPVISKSRISSERARQYSSGKIIVANMTKVLEAVADDGSCAGSVPTLQVFVSDEAERLYLLSLLNSSMMSHMHRVLFGVQSLAGGYISFTKDQLGTLILPPAVQTASESKIRPDIDYLRGFYRQTLEESWIGLLRNVGKWIAEGESDVIHDLLAYLAEQMIELNKQKQAEVKRFLAWVEAKLDGRGRGDPRVAPTTDRRVAPTVSIDSFTGKTILQNYLGDYQKGEKELPWADFEYRLHQNRNRYPANLSEVKGEIQTEYEKSLAVLLPLKQQLAHTDALIDQIVYKLYGLTDEEIEIIERPAYEQALSDAKAAVVKDEKLQKDPEAAAEVMADKVLPAAQRLRQQVAMRAEKASLDKALPGWHLFPDEVATFLVTAEYNVRTQPDYLDFSTSVISYAKAVETMLYHRLFMRFRDESGATDADCANKFLQAFMRDEKKLTLGSISIILQSSKEAALRAFIAALYPLASTSFFGPDGVVTRLNDSANLDLRNAAAHDQTLARADARSARQWALGILAHL